ncbi:hypothetical protein EYF80_018081 [Liparis tanakae]|uniref:Uncharacterized protein n=1 Tax=Liparis tanakae TaxID=230148 RepID=A0A4Z2I1N2_9TELE|nr:hypothetical protein EYF80_018081 [Liparis tanakae]
MHGHNHRLAYLWFMLNQRGRDFPPNPRLMRSGSRQYETKFGSSWRGETAKCLGSRFANGACRSALNGAKTCKLRTTTGSPLKNYTSRLPWTHSQGLHQYLHKHQASVCQHFSHVVM